MVGRGCKKCTNRAGGGFSEGVGKSGSRLNGSRVVSYPPSGVLMRCKDSVGRWLPSGFLGFGFEVSIGRLGCFWCVKVCR